jgi:hypothetical protein
LSDIDPVAFTREANETATAAVSGFERALGDARLLPDDLVRSLTVSEAQSVDQALASASNRDIVRSFVAKLPPNEVATMVDARGNLSAEGLQRVKQGLLAKVYGGDAGQRMAQAFIESPDPGIRTIENAVFGNLPMMARLEATATGGPLSLAEDVAAATDVFARLKQQGTKIDDYLNQTSMFGRDTTPVQDALLRVFEDSKRSSRRLRDVFDGYATRAAPHANAEQADMFGDVMGTMMKEDVLASAIRSVGGDAAAEKALATIETQSSRLDAGLPGQPIARGPAVAERPVLPERPPASVIPETAVETPPPPIEPPPAPATTGMPEPPPRPEPEVGRRGLTYGTPERKYDATGRQERAAELSTPTTLTTEEEIARLRLDKFPEEIRDELLQAAKDTDFGARLRRGVLSDESVQQIAREYAPSVESAIRGARRGRAYNAEEVVGLRNLVTSQAVRVADLSEQLAREGFDVATGAQLASEQARLRAVSEIAFGGAPAEAGRALRQFRQLAQDMEHDPYAAGMRYLKKQYGSLDKAEEATAHFQKMIDDGADPVALVDFLRNAHGDWLNRLGIVRYASMLSGLASHGLNISGNVLKAGVAVTDKALMLGIDVARSKVTGAEREVFATEIGAQLHGMQAGAVEGARNGAFVMQHGFRPDDITRLDHLRGGFGTNIPGVAPAGSRAAGAVDFAMEGPLRALSAADAVFRGMAEGGHLAAEATAAAIKAGRDEGGKVSADVLREFMAKPALMDLAEELAARDVLQEQRPITNWIMQSRNLPGPQRAIVEAAIPFVRTPFNLMAQGLEMTPLGVVRVMQEARKGNIRGAEHAVAEMAVGTAVMAVASWQNLNGNLTGPRPESEAERSTLPPGWQPWSIRTTDEQGGAKYYPMAVLGPLAVPAVVAIIATEAVKKGGAINPATTALGVGQYFVDQTFFRGVSDLAAAMSQGGNKIENYVESVSTQYSPHVIGGGALGRQIQQITGQPLRDPHGALEALLATHPATAGMVPERRDVLGRPQVRAPGGLETALSPIRSSVENDEPVIAAYRRAGEGLPMAAPKQIRDPTRPDRRVDLTREQQDRWRVVFGAELQNQWRQAGAPRSVQELRRIEQSARDAASERVMGSR